MKLFLFGVVVGGFLTWWNRAKAVNAAREETARAVVQRQIAQDALSMALGGDPCDTPPNS